MPWLDALLERPPVTWRDLLDIAIVSIVVYEVLKLIRGTRAAQMAVALGLIVGTFYLSRALELQTVNWLIRNLVGYVVFAAIVLLQTDIRRALVHLGRGPFFRYLRRVEADEDAIEELVVALEKLAAERIGALVIVERGIGLRNHIESGILLDARLTYDLIVAVFQPSSPLHDGAVIVQGDRVAAAACFLPLSINPKLARELGSRHRAAVGVTEENDAVALVVSEETGAVSLVVDGRIDRHLAPDQLRQRLRGLLKRSQLGPERRLAVATMD
ncbi:MAG: diadenylate cyclase CdaA [Vicinamibacterales bacterium]